MKRLAALLTMLLMAVKGKLDSFEFNPLCCAAQTQGSRKANGV